jgi:hypothetical protein
VCAYQAARRAWERKDNAETQRAQRRAEKGKANQRQEGFHRADIARWSRGLTSRTSFGMTWSVYRSGLGLLQVALKKEGGIDPAVVFVFGLGEDRSWVGGAG